jgi:hypothetical protein
MYSLSFVYVGVTDREDWTGFPSEPNTGSLQSLKVLTFLRSNLSRYSTLFQLEHQIKLFFRQPALLPGIDRLPGHHVYIWARMHVGFAGPSDAVQEPGDPLGHELFLPVGDDDLQHQRRPHPGVHPGPAAPVQPAKLSQRSTADKI